MPNPLFLQVMGVSLSEYNAFSPAKKARFQQAATKKLGEVHETDIDSYNELTEATAKSVANNLIDEAEEAETDKEFE